MLFPILSVRTLSCAGQRKVRGTAGNNRFQKGVYIKSVHTNGSGPIPHLEGGEGSEENFLSQEEIDALLKSQVVSEQETESNRSIKLLYPGGRRGRPTQEERDVLVR